MILNLKIYDVLNWKLDTKKERSMYKNLLGEKKRSVYLDHVKCKWRWGSGHFSKQAMKNIYIYIFHEEKTKIIVISKINGKTGGEHRCLLLADFVLPLVNCLGYFETVRELFVREFLCDFCVCVLECWKPKLELILLALSLFLSILSNDIELHAVNLLSGIFETSILSLLL